MIHYFIFNIFIGFSSFVYICNIILTRLQKLKIENLVNDIKSDVLF